ncbi:MAG: ABC transporter permease [Alphaproteobacteria bacterium]
MTVTAMSPTGHFWRFAVRVTPTITLTAALLLFWEISVTLAGVPLYIVPVPSQIASRFIEDFASTIILPHLWTTFTEVIGGFFLAAILGIILGVIVGLSPFFDRLLHPLILGFQSVPKVALAPLIVLWFGFGLQSKIVMAAIIAFYPVLANVVVSLKSEDSQRILLMRALRANSMQTFVKLRLPSMLPVLFAGLEVALVFAIIGAIVGEFLGSSTGLGSVILQRQAAVDVSGVFSVLILLSLMGIILAGFLKVIAHRVAFWAYKPLP